MKRQRCTKEIGTVHERRKMKDKDEEIIVEKRDSNRTKRRDMK